MVDWGPMTLSVSVWDRGLARPVMAALAARQALQVLRDLADFQNYLKRDADGLDPERPLPSPVRRAVEAVRAVGRGLTPLAAVAGAAADEVADHAAGLGADKVIVNNGGDIALRLNRGQKARVGLRPPAGEGERPTEVGVLTVRDGDGLGGVASSGWSGRSFSPGVADLVTVWAACAALADAAATFIAGRAETSSPAVRREAAGSIQADSDLADLPVTRQVGALTPEERAEALESAVAAAAELSDQGLIMGCFILLQGDHALLDPDGRMELGPMPKGDPVSL